MTTSLLHSSNYTGSQYKHTSHTSSVFTVTISFMALLLSISLIFYLSIRLIAPSILLQIFSPSTSPPSKQKGLANALSVMLPQKVGTLSPCLLEKNLPTPLSNAPLKLFSLPNTINFSLSASEGRTRSVGQMW